MRQIFDIKFDRELGVKIGIIALTVFFLSIFSLTAWCAQSDYDGTYAGTYAGDDNGYWVAMADSTGFGCTFLSYSTTNDTGDVGFMGWWGEAGGIGNYYTDSTEIQDSWVDAYIDSADGSVYGWWGNNLSGDTGTLSGDELTSSAYAGTYSGTFSGDDSGTWTLTIASNGYITGTMTSNSGGSGDFEGGCHPDGFILVVGDAGGDGFAVFGQISGSDINGSWISEDGSEGTIGSGSSGGGGGGGGGCFISILNK